MGRTAAGGVEGEFPGGPEVRTPCFQCRGHGFDPWYGISDPANREGWPKKKKKLVVLFFDVLILDTIYCLPVLTF